MAAMERDGANAIETRLGRQTLAFAAKMDGKLYLTVGWPETALLAAAPDFWPQAREIDKNAIKTAAEQARAHANADLMAREDAFRKLPNVAISQIEHDDQMQLAMRAGGGGAAAMAGENALWRKAEIEVHGQAPSSPGSAAPSPAMATDVAGAVRHRPQ